jgi:hypothetical protein
MVKIDVEGYEPEVFSGLSETLRTRPPEAIVFEFNHTMLSAQGSSGNDLLTMLEQDGYRVHRIGERGDVKPAPSLAELATAAARWESQERPASRLRIGLGTRKMLFNAVALRT